MPTARRNFSNGLFYHVYNCGVEKRNIFANDGDYRRFLELISYYLYDQPISFTYFKSTDLERKHLAPDWKDRRITTLVYCLMPNHFHFLVRQEKEFGIVKFVSDLTNSYTKYFNLKYQRLGHLFQGRFKAKIIESEESLIQVARYIHLNPAVSTKVHWVDKLEKYPYSSYRNFVEKKSSSIIVTREVSKYIDLSDHKKFVEAKKESFDNALIDGFLFGKTKTRTPIS